MHAQGPEILMLTGPHVVLMCTNVAGLLFYKEEYNEIPGSSKIGKKFACITEHLSVEASLAPPFSVIRGSDNPSKSKG